MQRPSSSPEFQDFIANHKLRLSHPDLGKMEQLEVLLASKTYTYEHLLALFDNDHDELCQASLDAFSRSQLSRHEMATLLDYRAIQNAFQNVEIVDLLDDHNQLTDKVHVLLRTAFTPAEKDKLQSLLRTLPKHERCLFLFTSPKPFTPAVEFFLQLSVRAKVLFEDKTKPLTFAWGSASVREAIVTALYGENAKKSFPRLGHFSINDIEKSMRRKGRYCSQSFPGIKDTIEFHGIIESAFLATLHDELHRALISSIPNFIFDGLISAIDLVREKTGITWSKEIWDAFDMEIDDFIQPRDELLDLSTPSKKMDAFCLALNAKISTQLRHIGLFTADAHLDTTWILMIDFALNRATWAERRLDPEAIHTRNPYYPLYQAAKAQVAALRNLPAAEQVALVKSDYFKLEAIDKASCVFVKTPKRFIQIECNGKPLTYSKLDVLYAYTLNFMSFYRGYASHPETVKLFFASKHLFINGGSFHNLLLALNHAPQFLADFIQAFKQHPEWLAETKLNKVNHLVFVFEKLHPEIKSKMENYFLESKAHLSILPPRDLSDLVSLEKHAPALTQQLIKNWVRNPDAFLNMNMDIAWSQLLSSDEIEMLFNYLNQNKNSLMKLSNSEPFLKNVLAPHPDHAKTFFDIMLKPHHYSSVINAKNLSLFAQVFPNDLKDKLITPILSDVKWFTQLMTSQRPCDVSATMNRMSELFPGHEAILGLGDFEKALAVVKLRSSSAAQWRQGLFAPSTTSDSPCVPAPAFENR